MDANRISITPTIERQTPKRDFGQALKSSVNGVLQAGNLVGGLTGMPIVSSAVNAVSSLVNARGGANASTTSGIVAQAGTTAGGTVSAASRSIATTTPEPAGLTDMLTSMREEADRSMRMQMNMQTESREYNTLTNILKLRHDSAKAAINNIR